MMPQRAFAALTQELGERELIDKEIISVNPKKTRLAFLLGAGASKPKPSDIPTVKELLPDLLVRARRLDRADLRKLVDFCEETKVENIEDLLTAAQLSEFCGRNPNVLRLVEFLLFRRDSESERMYPHRFFRETADLSGVAFLQDTLQVLFGLLSSRMLGAQPNAGHTAIASHLKAMGRGAIVTTNYDCCMDLALGDEGKDFSYTVEFANPKKTPSSGKPQSSLIKLHGSLNWFYCETCQQVHQIDIRQTVADYLQDRAAYSVIAVCKACGGPRRGLLVPPLAMKFDVAPPLNTLIERAQDAFLTAEAIVVVGFSFADADLYISRMITKAMQTSPNRRMLVFDPDRSVSQKLRRQLSLRIANFDAKRVIRVTGDCAKNLPLFLDGKIMEQGRTSEMKGSVPAAKDREDARTGASSVRGKPRR
jgi:NAD-dependent SIR2 family protein deacetylase